jgi:F-type H+-transporting ATPase subunit epsilon
MSEAKLPRKLLLEVVTPEGLLLRDEVDDVVVPGALGYFGVLPGHTPFLSALGMGEISYGKQGVRRYLTCYAGFCEVLPDRVNILAEAGERVEDIDAAHVEEALARAAERLKAVRDEEGYEEASQAYRTAVTRKAAARRKRG